MPRMAIYYTPGGALYVAQMCQIIPALGVQYFSACSIFWHAGCEVVKWAHYEAK